MRAGPVVRALGSVITGLVAMGCSQGPGEPELNRTQQTILSGYPSPPEQNATVFITHDLKPCTGVVVAPTLVLTARNCLFDLPDSTMWKTYIQCVADGSGEPALKANDPTSYAIAVGTGARRVEAHGLRFHSGDTLDICANDVALVEVDTPLSPAPLAMRLDSGPRLNETGKLVGWGVSEDSPLRSPQDRLQHDVQVLAIGGSAFGPLQLTYGSFITAEAGCFSDQGGAFISDESHAIVGIFTRLEPADPTTTLDAGLAYCRGARDVFRSLDAQSEWIRDAFARTNQVPWLEGRPPLAAVGESCARAGDCLSDVCKSTTGGAQFCSQDCSSADCPDGLQCVGPARERWCVPKQVPSTDPASVRCSTSFGGHAHGQWLVLAMLGVARLRQRRRRSVVFTDSPPYPKSLQ